MIWAGVTLSYPGTGSIGHEHAARLVDNGRVAQLLVGVPGGQDRDRRLVDRRVAQTGVEVAGDVRGRRGPADAAPADRGADERGIPPVVLRDHCPGEVEGRAGNVGVDVHSAGEDDHPGRVERPAALHGGDDFAIADADVPDFAVDAVGRVVHLPAGDPQH
jgi:hypothetical protein